MRTTQRQHQDEHWHEIRHALAHILHTQREILQALESFCQPSLDLADLTTRLKTAREKLSAAIDAASTNPS